MSKHYWLFMLVTALSWFNTGVVWLIQFSCYPLWRLVGQEEFLVVCVLLQRDCYVVRCFCFDDEIGLVL